jgi:hypothetical protein
MKKSLTRVALTLGVSVTVLLPMAGTASAVAVTPVTPRVGKLVQVGPLAEHGFPGWYRDSSNVRLEACLTLDDPLCPVPPDAVADPEAPVSFPGSKIRSASSLRPSATAADIAAW